MLTPGMSQDNIRGFFYRGNVNIGGGAREYSNGFVVDGVNNTWAQMGEPRQNFAMDSIREFKVSTVELQGGVRPRDRRRADGRDQVRHQSVARLGASLFFRDKALTAKTVLRSGAAGLPPLSVRRHASAARSCRNRTHFFARRRRHRRKPVLHGQRPAARLPQYDGTYAERPVSLDLLGEGRSSADADPDAVRARRTGDRIPSDHHRRRPRASDQQLRLRGAARLVRRRSHLGGRARARINDLRAASTRTRSTKCRRRTATDRGSRATSATDRLRLLHAPSSTTRRSASAAAATARWDREARGSSDDDFSY